MPTTVGALLIMFVVGVPGYVWQRAADRAAPERVTTALQEILGVLFGGALLDAAGVAVAAVVSRSAAVHVDVVALTTRPAQYLRAQHQAAAASLGGIVLVSACLIGWLAGSGVWAHALPSRWRSALLRRRARRDDLSSWWSLFHGRDEQEIYVGCLLGNGDYVAGSLLSFSRRAKEDGDRDLVLSGEIEYRPGDGGQTGILPDVGVAVVSARNVSLLTITYLDPPPAPPAPPTPLAAPAVSRPTPGPMPPVAGQP
jgi:Family of unknown function (DUF6338)